VRQRAGRVEYDERAWLQSVVGALAIDVFDATPSRDGADRDDTPRRGPASADKVAR
jgi:hypothetical protein